MLRCLALGLSIVLSLSFSPVAIAQPVEARESFEGRQTDLVTLAGHLGALHRLQQLCASGYRVELYRERMQEIVRLEAPMGSTRLDMIEAFNSAYRDMSRLHISCGDIARETREGEAQAALLVVERLYAPFR